MARIDGPAYTGQISCNLDEVKDILVDLPPGGLRGARTDREGVDGVLGELAEVMPAHGNEAEIHGALYTRVVDATNHIDKLRIKERLLEKLLEVVRETRGKMVNNREDDIGAIAAKAEETARRQKKPELLALFEKTIRYRSEPARKALKTRKKNEQSTESIPPESNG
ncbi:MAG: hypothetical protein IPM54_03670 [Polyangiaceae bacterium]|nr:hypothetical protein [Polyangiaceae bacterium]